MESGPSRTSKHSLRPRIPKLCKLRLVAVENPKPANEALENNEQMEGSGGGDEGRDRKVHPQPVEETLEEAVASRLFAAISALKCAYLQLQQAHIPYEPKKLRSADELMVSELKSLTELEELYTKKQRGNWRHDLSMVIEEQKCLLEELQSKIQGKDSEILRLRWQVEELQRKNAELEEEIKRKPAVQEDIFPLVRELNPRVFLDVFEMTSKFIHDFAKPLISLMKASGWDLDRAVNSIADAVIYKERSHKKYAFEAYLSRIMLSNSHDACFDGDHFDSVMSLKDPFDGLIQDPDSSFGRFCRSKYLAVVPLKMEVSFFGNVDQREFVLSGRHPRTPLYQAFVRMAGWAWTLQTMASSFIPKAKIFYAKGGIDYSEDHMESVVKMEKADHSLKVGFTVMPGYKTGGDVIRCQVYLCRSNTSNCSH